MGSSNERELLAASFDRHVDEEGKILAEYRTLAERLGENPVGFLTNLILTEEELHHLLLRTIAKWLREPRATDEGMGSLKADREALLRETQRLRKHEQETVDACRGLKPRVVEEGGELLESLLDAIILDSQKHHRLLVAVEKLLQA